MDARKFCYFTTNHGPVIDVLKGAFPDQWAHFAEKWDHLTQAYGPNTDAVWIRFVLELSKPNQLKLFEYIDKVYNFEGDNMWYVIIHLTRVQGSYQPQITCVKASRNKDEIQEMWWKSVADVCKQFEGVDATDDEHAIKQYMAEYGEFEEWKFVSDDWVDSIHVITTSLDTTCLAVKINPINLSIEEYKEFDNEEDAKVCCDGYKQQMFVGEDEEEYPYLTMLLKTRIQ